MSKQTTGDAMLQLLSRSGNKKRRDWKITLPKLTEEISLGLWCAIVALSAACGTGILFLLNTEARLIEYHGYSTLIAVLFLVLLIVYRIAQKLLISRAGRGIETALHMRRNRIADKVMKLSLRDVEDLEASRVMDGLSSHYGALSQAAVPLIAGVEGIVLLVFMYGYLFILSPAAGLLTAAIVAFTAFSYIELNKELDTTLEQGSKSAEGHRRLAEAIVQGAKELRLNNQKRTELDADMEQMSRELGDNRTASAVLFARVISTGTSVSYLLAGGVVFVLPIISSSTQDDISRIVMAVLFLLGPVGSVVNSVHHFSIAKFRLAAIDGFEDDVDRCLEKQGGETTIEVQDFESLTLERVGYAHPAEESEPVFAIRDVNMEITRGEIVFITGGNGSGKTTTLRALTGLYPRSEGHIALNGQDISVMPAQGYRDLFASVFADFHVFPKTYALDDEGRERLRDWLKFFEIEGKLPSDLSEIHPERLSTGQRKRLALALALAEDRPVLILDEWAADQDPATRERFYTKLLPRLQNEGRTVIAVTHDDQYFGCATRRYHMTEGRIEEIKT